MAISPYFLGAGLGAAAAGGGGGAGRDVGGRRWPQCLTPSNHAQKDQLTRLSPVPIVGRRRVRPLSSLPAAQARSEGGIR